MTKESILVNQIRLKASQMGWRLFRNNVGIAKQGTRAVRYGLCVGSSDLIGWRPMYRNVFVSPDVDFKYKHSQSRLTAQFIAIEVKTATGRVTKAQQHFIDEVNRTGGLGIIARSLEDIHD